MIFFYITFAPITDIKPKQEVEKRNHIYVYSERTKMQRYVTREHALNSGGGVIEEIHGMNSFNSEPKIESKDRDRFSCVTENHAYTQTSAFLIGR